MIIQEINAIVNGNSLSGEVIVPSPVLTSTKQAEDGNLTKSPNFQLKLTDVTPEMNIIDTVQVEFTNGDFNYTAKMNVINTQQNGTVTLQYVDGLTVEEVDDSSYDDSSYDDSSDDPDEPVVDPVLSQAINDILGSNYDVVNDMSEEDALAAANNILYGGEESPR